MVQCSRIPSSHVNRRVTLKNNLVELTNVWPRLAEEAASEFIQLN